MEKLKVYDDTKEFWSEISPHLIAEESKNNLFLGLIKMFQDHPEGCKYQAAIRLEGKVVGALVCSFFHNEYLLIPAPTDNAYRARQLIESYLETKNPVHKIVGEMLTIEIFQKVFEEKGFSTKPLVTQGIYSCKKVIMPPEISQLHFRPATGKDVPLIGQWLVDFYREAIPFDPEPEGEKEAQLKVDNQMAYLVELNGEPVTMAMWSRDLGTSCSVNFVYTPKHLRRKGYASYATAKLTQHLLDHGKKEVNLYTDFDNPTSNKIYQNVGYEFVCNSLMLEFDQKT